MSLLDLVKQDRIYPCGCIGKQGNDPYCPCEMRSRGLERKGFLEPLTPNEKTKISDMFKVDAK